MRHLLTLSLAALCAGCTAPSEGPTELSARGQSRLAEELRGRVAGETVSCVNQRDLRGNRSIGDEAILFDGPGNVVYVNRPVGGCPDLSLGRTLVTRSTSTRLCRGDIATVVDLASGTRFGGCGLGDFTPYRRVR